MSELVGPEKARLGVCETLYNYFGPVATHSDPLHTRRCLGYDRTVARVQLHRTVFCLFGELKVLERREMMELGTCALESQQGSGTLAIFFIRSIIFERFGP